MSKDKKKKKPPISAQERERRRIKKLISLLSEKDRVLQERYNKLKNQ